MGTESAGKSFTEGENKRNETSNKSCVKTSSIDFGFPEEDQAKKNNFHFQKHLATKASIIPTLQSQTNTLK